MFALLKFLIEDTKLRTEEKKNYQEEDRQLFEEHNKRLNEAIEQEKEKILKDEEKSQNSFIGKIVSSNEMGKKAKEKKNEARIDKVVKAENGRFEREKALLEKQRKEMRATRDKKRQKAIAVYGSALAILFCVVVITIGCIFEEDTNEVYDVASESTESVLEEKEDTKKESTQKENIQKEEADKEEEETEEKSVPFDLSSIPAYSGDAYVEVNDNKPYFDEDDITTDVFESYSNLDSLGRCGVAYANICKDIMPTEERGSIGAVRPSGWHTVKYNDYIADRYLYNRCHLIAFCLAGENANDKNLITGTRYMNVSGMLPFEEKVADYVDRTNHHVLYRVTPVFEGNNLVASGVLMEGKSIEDNTIEFCVFCYNVQPNIVIDYATGDSRVADNATPIETKEQPSGSGTNNVTPQTNSSETSQTNSSESSQTSGNNVTVPDQSQQTQDGVWVPTSGGTKYHSKSSCSGMKNPMQVSLETAIANGYEPCKRCH